MAGWKADCRGGRCACCCKTGDDTQAGSRNLVVAVPRHIVPVLFSPMQMRSFLCNERSRCSEEPQQHTDNRHSPRFADRETTKREKEERVRACKRKTLFTRCKVIPNLVEERIVGSRGMDCNLLLRVRTTNRTKRDADSAKTECEQKSWMKTKNFFKKKRQQRDNFIP
jgi:hypothetical protein